MASNDKLNLEDLVPDSNNSERMRRMKRLMRELYKEEFETKRFRLPPIRAKSLIVSLSFISIIVFGVTTLYNFNRFVTLEERVLSANGHVEDVLQRRVNLFENLINLTLNQSALEQEVFRHVADVRSSIGKGMNSIAVADQSAPIGSAGLASPAGGSAVAAVEGAVAGDGVEVTGGVATAGGSNLPMAGLAGLPAMARLLAVVEQYPEIRSSVTYQQLMDKLVEIENRIAKRRDEFNEEVRIYNTLISSFPWYVLARITGFERHEYFTLGGGMNANSYKMPVTGSHTFQRLLPVGIGQNMQRSGASKTETPADNVVPEIKKQPDPADEKP